MFRQENEAPDLTEVSDFIEKPSQNCNEEELARGVDSVLILLDKNPAALMTIIATHPFIPSTFLLDDLAEKMRKLNCLEKLSVLFDKCLNELVDACVYNAPDLKRLLAITPAAYSEKVIQFIQSNEEKHAACTLDQSQSHHPSLNP